MKHQVGGDAVAGFTGVATIWLAGNCRLTWSSPSS